MTVAEIGNKLGLTLKCGEDGIDREVTGGYVGDLLSLVMGKAQSGNAWVTIQTNINIMAVASLTDVAMVILAEGLSPDPNTAKRSDMEGIPIYSSEKTAFDIVCELKDLV